jgi:MFS family permease
MAEEMNTTPAMINYTVAIFVVAIGVAPLVWSPLSGFYGRKPVYLMSMPIMVRED